MGGRVAIETGLLYPERVDSLTLYTPALAWLRDRRWRWLFQSSLPNLGLLQPTPRALTEPFVAHGRPGRQRRLGGGRSRRVPARLPQAARPGRFLQGTPEHLPRRAAWRGRTLDPARGTRTAGAVRLGQGGPAGADRFPGPRRAGSRFCPSPRTRLWPRAAARTARPDPRGDRGLPRFGSQGFAVRLPRMRAKRNRLHS